MEQHIEHNLLLLQVVGTYFMLLANMNSLPNLLRDYSEVDQFVMPTISWLMEPSY